MNPTTLARLTEAGIGAAGGGILGAGLGAATAGEGSRGKGALVGASLGALGGAGLSLGGSALRRSRLVKSFQHAKHTPTLQASQQGGEGAANYMMKAYKEGLSKAYSGKAFGGTAAQQKFMQQEVDRDMKNALEEAIKIHRAKASPPATAAPGRHQLPATSGTRQRLDALRRADMGLPVTKPQEIILDTQFDKAAAAFLDELHKISSNELDQDELHALLGRPVTIRKASIRKIAGFGGFAPGPPTMGSPTPPKFDPNQSMNSAIQAQKGQMQIQMAQQQPQMKLSAAENLPDNDMTKERLKQFLKNVAVMAPASALGVGLGHFAGEALKNTNLGQTLKHTGGGVIPHAIGAVALTTGAAALKSMIDSMADKKVRDAKFGQRPEERKMLHFLEKERMERPLPQSYAGVFGRR